MQVFASRAPEAPCRRADAAISGVTTGYLCRSEVARRGGMKLGLTIGDMEVWRLDAGAVEGVASLWRSGGSIWRHGSRDARCRRANMGASSACALRACGRGLLEASYRRGDTGGMRLWRCEVGMEAQ